MRIKYSRPDKSYPPLKRIKPLLAEAEQDRAKLEPPPALPSHCKPWLDAHSLGLQMVFPFPLTLSIIGRETGFAEVEIRPAEKEAEFPGIVGLFAAQHFGLATDYYFKTEPGVGLYVNALPDEWRPKGQLVRGLLETWWYPKHLFLVFKTPAPGEVITFEYGDPLAVLIPVLCEPIHLEEFSPQEEDERRVAYKDYQEYANQHPEVCWTSAEGREFARTYKIFSKMHTARRPRGVSTG